MNLFTRSIILVRRSAVLSRDREYVAGLMKKIAMLMLFVRLGNSRNFTNT